MEIEEAKEILTKELKPEFHDYIQDRLASDFAVAIAYMIRGLKDTVGVAVKANERNFSELNQLKADYARRDATCAFFEKKSAEQAEEIIGWKHSLDMAMQVIGKDMLVDKSINRMESYIEMKAFIESVYAGSKKGNRNYPIGFTNDDWAEKLLGIQP